MIILQVSIDLLFLNYQRIQQIQIDLTIQQIPMYLYFLKIPYFLKILNYPTFQLMLTIPMSLMFQWIQNFLMNHLPQRFQNFLRIQYFPSFLMFLLFRIVQKILNYLKNPQCLKILLLCSRIFRRIYKFVWSQMNKLKLLRVHC